MLQNITQIVKNNLFQFEKDDTIMSKHHGDFVSIITVSITFIILKQKASMNLIKTYFKIKIFVTM